MIVLILLQRSEGGALGMGGGGGGFVTGRAAANLLTKITASLAAIFFATSLTLGVFSHRPAATSAVGVAAPAQNAPASAPGEAAPQSLPDIKLHTQKAPAPATPAAPAQPGASAVEIAPGRSSVSATGFGSGSAKGSSGNNCTAWLVLLPVCRVAKRVTYLGYAPLFVPWLAGQNSCAIRFTYFLTNPKRQDASRQPAARRGY